MSRKALEKAYLKAGLSPYRIGAATRILRGHGITPEDVDAYLTAGATDDWIVALHLARIAPADLAGITPEDAMRRGGYVDVARKVRRNVRARRRTQ